MCLLKSFAHQNKLGRLCFYYWVIGVHYIFEIKIFCLMQVLPNISSQSVAGLFPCSKTSCHVHGWQTFFCRSSTALAPVRLASASVSQRVVLILNSVASLESSLHVVRHLIHITALCCVFCLVTSLRTGHASYFFLASSKRVLGKHTWSDMHSSELKSST